MANLYEINKEIENFEFEIDEETGEILNALELDDLELERSEKIENIGLFIKNLKADAVAYKAEKQSFAERQKQAENKVNNLEMYLKNMLQGESFKTEKVAISYRKSTAVEITDIEQIPSEFIRTKMTEEPDKIALKNALEDGTEINGCHLVKRQNMTIK